ncbi:heavy metal-binding domain-containing protein [Conexibacter woesei]|uniref:heavy metal-binding domain-containing protein n=1 Tax=Conexibacter woesei TaxID=191495 RepID=UPI0004282B54|nr:heavy metal-binding domain-containing protein [Conexibacter woesei]
MSSARPFTSALGTREAFAVAHAGFVPIRQVMGASFHTLGWRERLRYAQQVAPADPAEDRYVAFQRQEAVRRMQRWQQEVETVELERQTTAWNSAREQAIEGLRAEAAACGADLVLGVTIKRLRRDWVTDLVEFAVTGTAVRSRRYAVGDDGPLLSTLSGQDVAKLSAHGFWPVGIAGGSTVAQVMTTFGQGRRPGLLRGWRNEEVPDWTTGMRDAYRLALRRVERGAHEVYATGVVGVEIERHVEERDRDDNDTRYHDIVVEIHALGTAIAEIDDGDALPPFKYIALKL